MDYPKIFLTDLRDELFGHKVKDHCVLMIRLPVSASDASVTSRADRREVRRLCVAEPVYRADSLGGKLTGKAGKDPIGWRTRVRDGDRFEFVKRVDATTVDTRRYDRTIEGKDPYDVRDQIKTLAEAYYGGVEENVDA